TRTSTLGTCWDDASVEPRAGEAVSQPGPPLRAVVDTVQLTPPRPGFKTPNDCGGTTPPPEMPVKLRPLCDKRRACSLALMVMVTGIARRDPDALRAMTEPV